MCILLILLHSLRMSRESCVQMISPHDLQHMRADTVGLVGVLSDKYGWECNNNEWMYSMSYSPVLKTQGPQEVIGTGNPLAVTTALTLYADYSSVRNVILQWWKQ